MLFLWIINGSVSLHTAAVLKSMAGLNYLCWREGGADKKGNGPYCGAVGKDKKTVKKKK